MHLKIIGKYVIAWGWAPKKTVWFDNNIAGDSLRRDLLLAFTRVYSRNRRSYAYSLNLGRLHFSLEKLDKRYL